MTNKMRYIGLMSGTSADGIDLALVEFDGVQPQQANGASLLASYYQAYDNNTQQKIMSLYNASANEIDRAGSLNIELAQQFSQAIIKFLQQEKLSSADITAIGCHGQTIRHRPMKNSQITTPFTLQIGCLQTLALLTGIRVVGDFRTKDIALGGQGAPLVPAFHQAIFGSTEKDVFVVNIGGIANITFLPKNAPHKTTGFDTGPGNALMDYWFELHQSGRYDAKGQWANSGQVCHKLLHAMLSEPYFSQAAPKSTGREYFNAQWLAKFTNQSRLQPADIQATLTALTAETVAQEINQLSTKSDVYLCGGGIENNYLVSLLNQKLNNHSVVNTQTKNINSDSLEAMAFAWLALAFDKNIFGNIPAVTGANKPAVLGISVKP
ncbi:anhydro-N-acetylmuramic acid kinase [Colwellia sp. MB02u-6]|uniref:anhydro-N-acetylmuramic acid kinase n=1 Tax=Colwellia sp. MB02u-6 TaxID=2759824 RepID=UPI0015F3886C|nr:anhydro-N-acetylmuramic acid kinase [Colwellia sp. MB02u-6]MBA6328201.1 anhydro-N-acetylmuramic acid kinase [Colwellia sp. MB02u-6]